MKKKTIFILLICSFILIMSGCSGNSSLIQRKLNEKNDTIKFYGFDWLTEKKEIDNKFNSDFGADSYECIRYNPSYDNQINENYYYEEYDYIGKDNKPLNWIVAGHKLNSINMKFIRDNKNNRFLYSACYEFIGINQSDYEDIVNKLDKLYKKLHEEDLFEKNYEEWMARFYDGEYIDKNHNVIDVFYDDDELTLNLSYSCIEVYVIMEDLQDKYSEIMEDSTNGL